MKGEKIQKAKGNC